MCRDRLYPIAICVAVLVGLLLPGAVGAQAEDEAASESANVDQSVALRPRFVLGQSSRYRVWTLRQKQTSMVYGDESRDQDQTIELEREITWTVDQVADDGSATFVMTRQWMTVSMTLPDGSVAVNDSREASGDNEGTHQALQAMIGVPLHVSVAADGSITAVSGVDAMRQQAPEGSIPEDSDFMRFASELATIPFAPATSTVGDEFEAEFNWPHNMGMRFVAASLQHRGTYHLAAVESIAGVPIAVVKGETDFSLEPDLSKLPPEAPAVDVKLLDAEQSSEVYFDLWRHETVMSNVVRSVRHEVVMPLGDKTLTRTVDESVQTQVLRVGEE